jgi:hypothetical protein
MEFKKWDIIYTSRFPESIKCHNSSCGNSFLISDYSCPHCSSKNNVSNVIAKIRPVLLWIDQSNWYESMTFGIPLSSGRIFENKYNYPVLLTDYTFLHSDGIYNKPMRAVIHQATRIDGNVFRNNMLIGRINNAVVQQNIENRLLDWLWK